MLYFNSERVLKFNIEMFNKWIVRIGNWEDEAPDMAVMTMRECLDSMRRLGTKDLYDVVSALLGFRIEQLEARLVPEGDEKKDYLFKTAAERGIEILNVYKEMFDQLRTR
jgi:hypothetical protein